MGAKVFFIDSRAADNKTLIAGVATAVRHCRLDATVDGPRLMAGAYPGELTVAGFALALAAVREASISVARCLAMTTLVALRRPFLFIADCRFSEYPRAKHKKEDE